MSRRLIALLAATTLLLVGACSSSSNDKNDSGVPAQLQFTAKTVDGESFSGENLLGQSSVLWFWAPWCPQCQHDAPMVAKVAKANADITFVGVGARDQPPALKEFVDKYHLDGFTELADTDATVWTKFGVTHQPAYAFIGKDGKVEVVKDTLSESDLTERIHALVNR
jgi:peroxiredoxin